MKLLMLLIPASMFLFAAFAMVACSGSNGAAQDIPGDIIKRADDVIISKTGKDFFDLYITHDFDDTKIISQGYYMSYRFYMPERPFVDEKITFVLDSAGVLRNDMEITGIPECVSSPGDCRFLIDKNEARRIAAEEGLQKGIKDWGITFMWNGEYKKYVWHILSTLKGVDTPEGFRGSGIEFIIDPNSGIVLKKNEWNVR